MKRDLQSKLFCTDCAFSSRSETVFSRHLIEVHAVRPGQIPALIRKAEKLGKPVKEDFTR